MLRERSKPPFTSCSQHPGLLLPLMTMQGMLDSQHSLCLEEEEGPPFRLDTPERVTLLLLYAAVQLAASSSSLPGMKFSTRGWAATAGHRPAFAYSRPPGIPYSPDSYLIPLFLVEGNSPLRSRFAANPSFPVLNPSL